jgi:hypothetical protein
LTTWISLQKKMGDFQVCTEGQFSLLSFVVWNAEQPYPCMLQETMHRARGSWWLCSSRTDRLTQSSHRPSESADSGPSLKGEWKTEFGDTACISDSLSLCLEFHQNLWKSSGHETDAY